MYSLYFECSTGEKVGETGIDDIPTAGSDNLVKSGGVEKTKAYKYIPTQKYNGVVSTGILYSNNNV